MAEDNSHQDGTGSTSGIGVTRRAVLQAADRTSERVVPETANGRAAGTTRRTLLGGLAALTVGSVTVGTGSASEHPESEVPMPGVEGPVTGGVRTGDPQTASLVDVSEYGYVEEEYFVSGVARDLTGDGDPAAYTTRFLIYRPERRRDFNGTVVVNWSNVTSQYDVPSLWVTAYDYLMREGYVLVALSAQQQGVDGSPLAPRWWDPVRYGELNHPGDDYSYDILSQTVEALRGRPRPEPDPLSGYPARTVLATGASQSAGYLQTYINEVQELHGLVDGFLPFVSSPGENREDLRDDLVPILWVNSEDETTSRQRPDAGQFKLWEMAGASHVSEWWDIYTDEMRNRDQAAVDGTGYEADWDEWEAGQYGERGGSTCPGNLYPSHYVLRAATHYLNEWVTKNREAPSAPRIERDDAGLVQEDEHLNALGGVRLPVLEVPVATYEARTCSLWGQTIMFDPVTLDEMYPTHEDYVEQMEAAAEEAIENGWLLPADAEDLLHRARTSSIGE